MTDQPVTTILDGLGITIDLDDGDLIANAVVIAKVVGEDGDVGIAISSSDGSSWLDQLALITAASEALRSQRFTNRDDT